MSTLYRFRGRATGQDPTGYYHPRWDRSTPVSVVANTREDATRKAFTLLGTHPRFGVAGFGDRRDTPGWALVWDSIDEEPATVPTRDELEVAVGGVLFNAMNHPDPVAVWGKDVGPLRTKVVDAVMTALATASTTTEAEIRADECERMAAEHDREAAKRAAKASVADVRCYRCNLRHEERDQYSCGEPGSAHDFLASEITEAAEVRVEPTYYGDQLRARAAAHRAEAGS